MPIVDFNDPAPWDSLRIWRFQVTRAIHADIAVNSPRVPGKSVFDGFPNIPPIHVGFHRFMMMRENRGNVASKMPRSLNITSGDRVLLMGDVYGWVAEALAEAMPSVSWVSSDDTPLTQARNSETETTYLRSRITAAGVTGADVDTVLGKLDDGLPRSRRTVLDEDAADNGSRQRIRNELGGAPTHAITMGMYNFLFDSEAADISARLHDMGTGPVFHVVNPFRKPAHGNPELEPVLNWKHLTEDRVRDTMIRDSDGNTRSLDDEPNIGARSWKALLPNDWIVPHNTYNAHF